MIYSIETETDIERLRLVALTQQAEVRHLLQRIERLASELKKHGGNQSQLEMEVKLLQEAIDRRTDEIFGQSSEKQHNDPETSDCEANPSKADNEEKQKQTGHGRNPQLSLPVVEEIHELDEADMICPKCGKELQEFKNQFEESEEIDVIERIYKVVKHKRQKYICQCGDCVETALGPDKLIPGGRYSIDFAIKVAIDKYLDHLPLDRQVRMMSRNGLEVTSQTLWDQIDALSKHLLPTYYALHDYILSHAVIGADETHWRMLDNRKSKKWWVWAVTVPDAVFYQIHNSRNTNSAAKVLKDFDGVVVADGYSAYKALQKRELEYGSAFTLSFCWAHARRKFVKALPAYTQAQEMIDLIGDLYKVERDVAEEYKDEEESTRLEALLSARQLHSEEIVKKIGRWCAEQKVLPKSAIGRAIGYINNHWNGLQKFLDNSEVQIDNNQTERGMRGVAVGRKNHYGSRSKRGTEVAAIIYSLVESAKLAGINPEKYIKKALVRAIREPGTVTLPKDLLD